MGRQSTASAMAAGESDEARLRASVEKLKTIADGGPPEITNAELDAMALEEDEKRTMEALGALSEYGKRRAEISDQFGIPLAFLDREYKRRRREALAGGGIKRQFLEAPEPFPFPVDGRQLLRSLVLTIRRHVIMRREAVVAVALWIIHTHLLDAFSVSPILAVESPEKRCGKSTLLSIVLHLVRKGLMGSNISPAALYRVVDSMTPTLILDEADTFVTDEKHELRGIMNASHSHQRRRAALSSGGTRSLLDTVPKAFGLIGELPATIQDRAIVIRMTRKLGGENVRRRRADRTDDLHILCRRIARWAADNRDAVSASDPLVPPDLNDRAADNWRPLVAIADRIGGDWHIIPRKVAASFGSGNADRFGKSR